MNTSKKSHKDILQTPKGTRDFFGDSFAMKELFYNYAQKTAESFGFSGIETPILEHTEIFAKGVGAGTDIVDKEMYNLETSGGDMLTLRPEGTASVMRAYIEHGMTSLPQPVAMYYKGPFFRHEKPQKGRYRQLYQFGLELMGSKDYLHDVLIISVGYNILQFSGKDILVAINSLGSKEERASYLETLKAFYLENQNDIAKSDRERIETNPLRVLDSKEPSTQKVNQRAPKLMDSLGEESKEYFNNIITSLETLGINYEVNSALVRGLDYYEHTVFEFITRDKDGNNSLALGGGGRYDGLAETMGHTKSVPAVGLGLGVDRILELVDTKKVLASKQQKHVFFISLDKESHLGAIALASKLSLRHITMHLGLSDANIGKQFAKAEGLGCSYVIMQGEDERKKNQVTLKNLDSGEQEEISVDMLEVRLAEL